MSSASTPGEFAAVHDEIASGQPASPVGHEKEHRVGDVVGLTIAPQRRGVVRARRLVQLRPQLPRRFAAGGGGSAGSPFQINQTDSTDQDQLAIAFDGTNYLAVWMWDVGTGSGAVINWDIYARLVSTAGTFPGSELHLVTDPGSQYFPSLTFDGANYLLAWGDNPAGAALSSRTNYVRFQFLNRSASAIGPVFNLFAPQGTNFPVIGGVLFEGNKLAAVATLASLIVDTNGDFQGFASASVYGALISSSTASPAMTAKEVSP